MISSPSALLKGVRIRFLLKSEKQKPSELMKLAFMETSDTDSETYEWLGNAPQMSEAGGARTFTSLSNTTYSIANVSYKSGVQVLKDHIDDNKSGSIKRRIDSLATVAATHPGKIMSEKIVSGTTDLCYDGAAFFANAHPVRSDEGGTQDNLLAGTGVTAAALRTDIAAAKSALRRFKSENGEVFQDGDMKLVVVVPTELEIPMAEAIRTSTVSTGGENIHQGMAEIIVDPRLSDVNDWYTFVVDEDRKPMIWQNRAPLKFSQQGAGSADEFHEGLHSFGADVRYGCGYGYWQSAIKTVNA